MGGLREKNLNGQQAVILALKLSPDNDALLVKVSSSGQRLAVQRHNLEEDRPLPPRVSEPSTAHTEPLTSCETAGVQAAVTNKTRLGQDSRSGLSQAHDRGGDPCAKVVADVKTLAQTTQVQAVSCAKANSGNSSGPQDALLLRLQEQLKQQDLTTEDLPLDNDQELAELLKELGFESALERTKLRKSLRKSLD